YSQLKEMAPNDTLQLSAVLVRSSTPVTPQPPFTWQISGSPAFSLSPNGLLTTSKDFDPAQTTRATVTATTGTVGTGILVASTIVEVRPVQAGLPAYTRFINTYYGAPDLTFVTRDGRRTVVPRSGIVEKDELSGAYHLTIPEFVSATSGPQYATGFDGVLTPGSYSTFYAVGAGRYPSVIPMSDAHEPVPQGKALVRFISSTTAYADWTNNFFIVAPGALAIGVADLCYFDTPGFTSYMVRDPGDFDLVMTLAIGPTSSSANQEIVRMRGHAVAGTAMTFVIMGDDLSNVHLMGVTDH
ncbi:MAG: hypothetical protein ABIS27_13685, partial [Longimicrobiales bacterium]